jgi:hypothetical protein
MRIERVFWCACQYHKRHHITTRLPSSFIAVSGLIAKPNRSLVETMGYYTSQPHHIVSFLKQNTLYGNFFAIEYNGATVS